MIEQLTAKKRQALAGAAKDLVMIPAGERARYRDDLLAGGGWRRFAPTLPAARSLLDQAVALLDRRDSARAVRIAEAKLHAAACAAMLNQAWLVMERERGTLFIPEHLAFSRAMAEAWATVAALDAGADRVPSELEGAE